jgi:hypothetical protein
MSFVREFEESEERAQANRLAIAAANAERDAAETAARAAAIAAAAEREQAAIEARVKSHFVGTPEEFEREKADLIRAERWRMSEAAARQARTAMQSRYSE